MYKGFFIWLVLEISINDVNWQYQFDTTFSHLKLRSKKKSVVNFTNILLVHLRQYLCAKKFNLYFKHKNLCAKLSYEKAACKMLVKKDLRKTLVWKKLRVKCWWNWPLEKIVLQKRIALILNTRDRRDKTWILL